VGLINNLQENIFREEGLIYRLLNDEELYDSLIKSANELETLLNDIRKNPRRYFRFSVF